MAGFFRGCDDSAAEGVVLSQSKAACVLSWATSRVCSRPLAHSSRPSNPCVPFPASQFVCMSLFTCCSCCLDGVQHNFYAQTISQTSAGVFVSCTNCAFTKSSQGLVNCFSVRVSEYMFIHMHGVAWLSGRPASLPVFRTACLPARAPAGKSAHLPASRHPYIQAFMYVPALRSFMVQLGCCAYRGVSQ